MTTTNLPWPPRLVDHSGDCTRAPLVYLRRARRCRVRAVCPQRRSERSPRAALWAVLLAATAAAWRSPAAAAAASSAATDPHCPVATVPGLIQALNNPHCNLIQIEGSGLTLSQTAWAAALGGDGTSSSSPAQQQQQLAQQLWALSLSRNVTLVGGGAQTVLDCGYLKSRIAVAPGSVLRLRAMTLVNCRQPSALLASGVDLVTLTHGSMLLLEHVTYEVALCAPPPEMARLAAATPRPPEAPAGQQSVRLVAGACAPPPAAASPPPPSAAAVTTAGCVDEAVVLYDDFAQNGTLPVPGGARASPGDGDGGGGLVLHRNVSLLCMEALTASCVAARGLERCAAAAVAGLGLGIWDAFDLPPPTAAAVTAATTVTPVTEESGAVAAAVSAGNDTGGGSGGGGGGGVWSAAAAHYSGGPSEAHTQRLLAIVVPTVVLGLGLLMACVALLLWTRTRKKFSPCPVAIKEAYEGVVFVGLSQASDEQTALPTLELELELDGVRLSTASSVMLAGPPGPNASAAKGFGAIGGGLGHPTMLRGPGLGLGMGMGMGHGGGKHLVAAGGGGGCTTVGSGMELVSEEAWSGDGHRYPPSWDGNWDGRGGGGGGGGHGGSPSLTASASACTCSSAPAIVGILSAGPLHHHAGTTATTTSATAATPPATSNHHNDHNGNNDGNDDNNDNDDNGNNGGNLLDSGGAASGEAPSSPRAPVNLVLGVDVIVTAQPVLGRSPLGSAMLGQFGQVPVAVRRFRTAELYDRLSCGGGTGDGGGGGVAGLKAALKRDIEVLAARCGGGGVGRHPNVVAVLGAGEAVGGEEVFVLEELMTTNLARLLAEGPGALPLERALSIAVDVALGLSYLHPDIVHRNLKPESVLLDSAFNAKVADYGFGRLLDWGPGGGGEGREPEITRARYMAPECFRARERSSRSTSSGGKPTAGPQADVYSLGVLLWEMLAREVPWRDLTAAQIALAVGGQNRRLDMPMNDRFPPKLRRLILQCWDPEPRKRPSAAEVAKRLSQMLHQHRTSRR